ncbi:MAG: hypothetical protein RLZZ246_1137, partial [Planctomycetota bacterium]
TTASIAMEVARTMKQGYPTIVPGQGKAAP